MDRDSRLWVDAHTAYSEDDKLIDDDTVIVLKTEEGIVIDASYLIEDVDNVGCEDDEPEVMSLLPQHKPDYAQDGFDIEPEPVVGLITSSLERGIFSGILSEHYQIDYPPLSEQPTT